MFYLKDGNIIPNEGIGELKLGMSFREVTELVKEYDVRDLSVCDVIECGDVRIWIDRKTDSAIQILVEGEFKGKYADKIGIGSTLTDVKNLLNASWHEDLDAYYIDGVEGMCLELGDTDDEYDWDELAAPIVYISVMYA